MNILLVSLGITFLLIVCFSRLFRTVGWLDKPQLFGYQRSPVPYGIGIVFFLVFLLLVFSFLSITLKLTAVLTASGLITLVSFIDDRLGLSASYRLGIQIISALIIVLAGIGVPAISNPFGGMIVLDSVRWTLELGGVQILIEPLANLVALLWIVFVMNAMNWLDGSPGIVSGISTIACFVLYGLASMSELHVIDQSTLSTMALILGGSSLVFLCFDFPKPKILMGDSGTMFLGLMIAVMAIFSGGKLATAFIVLAFPILDAAWTIVRRIIKRQSPFKGDFQHFHHELMKAGLSQRQVNIFYYVVSLCFGFIALFLQSFGKLLAILLLFGLMVTVRLIFLRKKSE